MRQLGANIRMRKRGDVLELEDGRGKIRTEKLWLEKSRAMRKTDWIPFRKVVGICHTTSAFS